MTPNYHEVRVVNEGGSTLTVDCNTQFGSPRFRVRAHDAVVLKFRKDSSWAYFVVQDRHGFLGSDYVAVNGDMSYIASDAAAQKLEAEELEAV